jgi:hypothetical protein
MPHNMRVCIPLYSLTAQIITLRVSNEQSKPLSLAGGAWQAQRCYLLLPGHPPGAALQQQPQLPPQMRRRRQQAAPYAALSAAS